MISIDDFSKAMDIFKELKQLEMEISEIESFSQAVVDGNFNCSFSLEGNNNNGHVELEKKTAGIIGLIDALEEYKLKINSGQGCNCPRCSGRQKNISSALSENATLQILGVLLGEKQQRRFACIKSLKELGVQSK